MTGSSIKQAARTVTSPFRGYLNQHFEQVKDEVRRVGANVVAAMPPPVDIDVSSTWVGVVELENAIAELSLYQGRLVSRLTDEVAELNGRIADLERIVAQLADVVGEAASESVTAG